MINCFNCSMNEKRIVSADIIFQYSDNLGFLEKRKIEIIYNQQKFNVLKTPWTKCNDDSKVGFYCGKCNTEITSINEKEEEKDFVKEQGLNDIRKKYITSGDFNSDNILKSIIENYSEKDFKIYVEAEREGLLVEFPKEINSNIKQLLTSNFGISKLYKHQSETIEQIFNKRDVILETSTASGKSLAYNIPIITKLLENPNYRFLYISPTKALAIDQMRTITKFGKNAKGLKVSDAIRELYIEDNDCVLDEEIAGQKITLVKFDSDINTNERNKAIESGNIFYSTPDKIHATVLQFFNHKYKHQGKQLMWTDFFKNLKYVVIDEIHTYKGVFGANVAYVMRRLQRLCEQNGNKELQFISCSATIENPKELADAITGRDNYLINVDTSPKKKRNYILLRPLTENENDTISPITIAADIVTNYLSREETIRSITFGRTMQNVRNTQRIIERRLNEKFSGKNIDEIVKFFQGNLNDKLRQKLINNFNNKEYHALIATIALELGMDLDDVHSVVMMGYPGTTSSFKQQAGRAGRKGEGLVVMPLFPTPLENYFFNNPEYFFQKPPEKVIIPLLNESILEKHLLFAELENGLTENDFKYFPVDKVKEIIDNPVTLDTIKKLYFKSLRTSISQTIEVYYGDECIANSIDINTAKRDIFEGAVFQQPDFDYVVSSVNWRNKTANLTRLPRRADYYTQSFSLKQIETVEILQSLQFSFFTISYEKVNFKNTRLNYLKIYNSGKSEQFDFTDFAEPIEFETNAFCITIQSQFLNSLNHNYEILTEGAVGIENSMFSMFSEIVECDINDVGSATATNSNGIIKIYIYDNFPNGLDFTLQAFNCFKNYLNLVFNLISKCLCENDLGCPACVQVYKPYQSPEPNRKIAEQMLNEIMKCL